MLPSLTQRQTIEGPKKENNCRSILNTLPDFAPKEVMSTVTFNERNNFRIGEIVLLPVADTSAYGRGSIVGSSGYHYGCIIGFTGPRQNFLLDPNGNFLNELPAVRTDISIFALYKKDNVWYKNYFKPINVGKLHSGAELEKLQGEAAQTAATNVQQQQAQQPPQVQPQAPVQPQITQQTQQAPIQSSQPSQPAQPTALPSQITLSLGAGKSAELGSDDTETFTQESFKDLIKAKSDLNLPFVLAVTTTKSQGREYYHFFDSCELNRYLRQGFSETPADNARNPINRQLITKIQYFIIRPKTYDFELIQSDSLRAMQEELRKACAQR